jgi:acetoin utilization deacetylase AcuC-like enzyme
MVKEFADSKCGGRRFAVLEGGYNHSVLGKNVKALLEGIM